MGEIGRVENDDALEWGGTMMQLGGNDAARADPSRIVPSGVYI